MPPVVATRALTAFLCSCILRRRSRSFFLVRCWSLMRVSSDFNRSTSSGSLVFLRAALRSGVGVRGWHERRHGPGWGSQRACRVKQGAGRDATAATSTFLDGFKFLCPLFFEERVRLFEQVWVVSSRQVVEARIPGFLLWRHSIKRPGRRVHLSVSS